MRLSKIRSTHSDSKNRNGNIKSLDLDIATANLDFVNLDRLQKIFDRLQEKIGSIQIFYVRGFKSADLDFETGDLDIATADLDLRSRNGVLFCRPRSVSATLAFRFATSRCSKTKARTKKDWRRSEILCVDPIFSWRRSAIARPTFRNTISSYSKTKARTTFLRPRFRNCRPRFRNARPRSEFLKCQSSLVKWRSRGNEVPLFQKVATLENCRLLLTHPLANTKAFAAPSLRVEKGCRFAELMGVDLETNTETVMCHVFKNLAHLQYKN